MDFTIHLKMEWGFLYKRQSELLLWCLVAKHSPYIPKFFDKGLIRYLAQFISYEIRVDMSGKFAYGNKPEWERKLIKNQRRIIKGWMTKHNSCFVMFRRTGKSTIIKRLVDSIPDTLSVLIFVHGREDFDIKRPNVTIEKYYLDSIDNYDFVFTEETSITGLSLKPHILQLKTH